MTRFGVPPKCRNHDFYRVKSFRGRCTQKRSSKKRSEKTSPPNKLLYKNVPLGGPQINPRPFCGRQTLENVVFRERGDSGKCPFCTRRPFWAAPRRPNILKVFWIFQGVAKKQGKTSVFLVVSCAVFFLYRLLMVTCRLDIPSCLQMCHSSLLSYFWCYVFLLSGGCVSLFLFIFILLVVIIFHLVVLSSLSSLLVWQKPKSNQKISQILIVIFCFGACIPTLSLGPDNNPYSAKRRTSQKICFFVAFMLGLLAMCWNTYFYCVFTHSSKFFAYKMGPKKNDNVSQNAKQESVF